MATLTPERVIRGYNDAVFQVREAVLGYATTAWTNAGSWRDKDVDRLINLILPRVQAGQLHTARLTSAYVAALAKTVDSKIVRSVPVVKDEILLARGVDQSIVYRRPAVEMYTALSKGSTLTQSVKQGVERLSSIIATDIQLSVTHQERRSYKGAGYSFTVRTLTGRENCALCVIASTQRYHVTQLRPIHPACDCGSRQISSKFDPGQVIDPKLLESVHDQIDAQIGRGDRSAFSLGILKEDSQGRRVSDYTDLIVTREHGEIGPILTWRSDQFTTAEDLGLAPLRKAV